MDGKHLKCCSKECLEVRQRQLIAQEYKRNPDLHKKRWSEWYKNNKDRYLANKKLLAKKKAESHAVEHETK